MLLQSGQLDVVEVDAVGEGILAGHEAAAKGTADGTAAHGMSEIEAVPRQLVEDWGLAIGIASIAGGLGAPFVSEEKDYVGFLHLALGSEAIQRL